MTDTPNPMSDTEKFEEALTKALGAQASSVDGTRYDELDVLIAEVLRLYTEQSELAGERQEGLEALAFHLNNARSSLAEQSEAEVAGWHLDSALQQSRVYPGRWIVDALRDRPEFDATDAAHPAWWRGNDRGVEATVEIVNAALDGTTQGTFQEPLQKLVERIDALREKVLTDEEARVLLQLRDAAAELFEQEAVESAFAKLTAIRASLTHKK